MKGAELNKKMREISKVLDGLGPKDTLIVLAELTLTVFYTITPDKDLKAASSALVSIRKYVLDDLQELGWKL